MGPSHEPRDILQRSLQMLERSQANLDRSQINLEGSLANMKRSQGNLERSQANLEGSFANLERILAIESTLSRLVNAQEDLRRMVLTFQNGTPVTFTNGVNLPAEDSAPLLRNEKEYPICRGGEPCDLYPEEEAGSSGEEADSANDKIPEAEGSRANSERLMVWKCAVCEKLIKGDWKCRRRHIESHEGLKLSCPVTGCSMTMSQRHVYHHLREVHKTTRTSLAPGEKAELQRQLEQINEKAMEFEMTYFPPRSLVSFAKTSGRNGMNLACKKCGKICDDLTKKRDHVAVHRNIRIPCPIRGCTTSCRVGPIKRHLSTIHGKTLATLDVEEEERFDENKKKFNEEVDAVIRWFFPEKQRTDEVDPLCKKCGKEVLKPYLRRDHVAAHLKVEFPCPFHDCSYYGRLATMFAHLNCKHKKNPNDLTNEQQRRYEESKRKFCEQVDSVMEEYFSSFDRGEEDVDLDDEGAVVLESTRDSIPAGEVCRRLSTFPPLLEPHSSGHEVAEDNHVVIDPAEEAGSSGEESNSDEDEITEAEGSRANSEKLPVWKCAVCEKMIREKSRQHHIECHEELKIRCPVTGCSTRISSHHFARHLMRVHKTSKSALPVEQRVEFQRQLKHINQKAMESKLKYFPPISLVSFAKTLGRIAVNPACKKCGKIYATRDLKRDHVGSHLNINIQCPLRGCKHFGCVELILLHLLRIHQKTLSKLTVEERYRFEEAKKKFYEEVDAAMGDFFPGVLQIEKRSTGEKSPSCKKCGKRASERYQKRDHVAVHLNAKFPCPFHDCRYSGHVAAMLGHLNYKHWKNLEKLTEEQRGRYEESRRKFCEQVDAVMVEYFP